MRGKLVVDERGRTSLARVRSQHYDRYTVEEPGLFKAVCEIVFLFSALLVSSRLFRCPCSLNVPYRIR